MQEDESRLVGQAQVAADREGAFAFTPLQNGPRDSLGGQLVAGEQRTGRDGAILLAALTAEAKRAVRATDFISREPECR